MTLIFVSQVPEVPCVHESCTEIIKDVPGLRVIHTQRANRDGPDQALQCSMVMTPPDILPPRSPDSVRMKNKHGRCISERTNAPERGNKPASLNFRTDKSLTENAADLCSRWSSYGRSGRLSCGEITCSGRIKHTCGSCGSSATRRAQVVI